MNTENTGLQLLKKGSIRILRMIFSRMGLVLVLLLLNLGLLFSFFLWFEDFLPHIYGGTAVFIIAMVLYLINSRMDSTSKLTWLVLIMLAPVFGSLLYFFTKRDWGHRVMAQRLRDIQRQTADLLPSDPDLEIAMTAEDAGAASLVHYVSKACATRLFSGTQVRYFPLGEDKFQCLLAELKKAEKFIFMEYFIIDEGVMWGQILEILAQKAKQGVEIRLIYDGACEFLLLPKGYPNKLKRLGIQCKVFSPATPIVSTHYNYRDHRKIVVIDGHTAFNGGVNLSDEYINIGSRFGHWKDTAVMLKGDAVKSFTLMFLQTWNIDSKEADYDQYIMAQTIPVKEAGYVMPYGDSPLDAERIGQRVYLDILSRAKHYVHIMTPYLILDQEMENVLCYTARKGVEVELLLPGIPDKKPAFALAKTHYKALVEAGVKIYEYTPGFVHAKVFVSDDREAVVGTINLDYRSLYHHFECATYMHGTPCITDIEKDFQSCIAVSQCMDADTIKKEKWYWRVAGYILKVFAPLM